MATLVKRKKSKAKTSKQKEYEVNTKVEELVDNEPESVFVDRETLHSAAGNEVTKPSQSTAVGDINDLVTSSSATTNDIIANKCLIASGSKDENISHIDNQAPTISKTVLENYTQEQEDKFTDNTTSPSAPPCMEKLFKVEPFKPTNVVHYPQLTHFQYEETYPVDVYSPNKSQSSVARLSASKLQPLTQEQLHRYYRCDDLGRVQQFEIEFLMNSLLETYESDPLFAALQEYYHSQVKLSNNLQDVKKFRQDVKATQDQIWIQVPITKTFFDKCGDRIKHMETVTYNIMQVDDKNIKFASSAMTALFDIMSNTYTNNVSTIAISKVRIDQIIDELTHNSTKDREGTVKLQSQLDSEALALIAQVRRALSILFHFSRKLSPSKNFDIDLRCWLRKLISLHLHLATKEDHWFLLFNILRCPSGVGAWACEFVHIPHNRTVETTKTIELPLQLNSPEISLCMSTLQILTAPIKKRNEYLKQLTQEITDSVTEERWTFIDSEGEDSHTPAGDCIGLKESDLIALLNQIPFEELFRSALSIEKFSDDYIIEADLITSDRLLQILAFFSQLITLFGEGMLTYNIERYKQLAKRLGRLMRHSLQYVSDYHELFKKNNLDKELIATERIALENKCLILKACCYIYRTRNLSTWQYFSSLPFSTMETDTIWQIFYYLNVGFPAKCDSQTEDYELLLSASDFWDKFNVANADSSAEDLYYLLQAFFEMANDRDRNNDWDLMKTICVHIFKIGFINDHTSEICYKTARDMLVNLTLVHEDLICCLLAQVNTHFGKCENVNYLFKSLPLEKWKPNMHSFETLFKWLLHFDFQTGENMLARLIIGNLNWSFDSDGNLFLPHNIHIHMACTISEAHTKHAPEILGLSGISESVRQVSSFIDSNQSTKEQFSTWCWSMVSMLHLHIMDQNVERVKLALREPSEPLMFVSELEHIGTIFQGVMENRPLALYVAVLASLHGHSIPLICQKGFELMQRLLSDHRHAAVIRCLELIVPLFLETPATLGNSEGFQSILNTLLNADKTYLKMAKDMVYPNTVGPVLELLENMIHHQTICYTNYGLSSPLNLINIWLNCLTSLPNWQNTCVVYLLDKILKVAYQFPDAHMESLNFFHNYYSECTEWKSGNKMSSFKGFFGGNLTKVPAISSYYPWLALVLLEIEFRTQDSYIWSELLRQLSSGGSKSTVDTALKKTLTIAKKPNFPAHDLVIYKYANLIANMDISHALFPIINQKFFELYLSRLPEHYDEQSFQQVYGVSDKFYDFNVAVMKKIKTQLKAAEALFQQESTKNAQNHTICCWYKNCSNIMKTYALWLEDTTMNTMSKHKDNYAPQYNNEKLKEIFNGNTNHWTEFLYLPAIHKEQRYMADQWARKCFRMKANTNSRSPPQRKAQTSAVERIKLHLKSYDSPLPPPQYIKPSQLLQQGITQHSLKELKEKLKVLTSTAKKFYFKTSELNAINLNYMDNIINLYDMVPYEEIKIKGCNSLIFNRQCTSPARIKTTLEMIRKNEKVESKLYSYREKHEQIIDEMLKYNFNEFAKCVGQIGQILRLLLVRSNKQHDVLNELKSNTGTEFFYDVIENMSDITMKFEATNKFYTELVNELAIFIQENQEREGSKILALALDRRDLIKSLSVAFVPSQTRPAHFLKMYKYLIDSHLKLCDTKILFVLFSKFDLILWLESYHPKLFDINNLLQLVLKGLESWSQSSDPCLLYDLFRRHLVHIFDYDFPEHYGEVMQMILDRISNLNLMPVVLLDLLNSLLLRFKCDKLEISTKQDKLEEISVDFARRQNLFNLKAATDTMILFARHFQKERFNHGLHGLYPVHKDYCKPLSMWFSCFGHCLVVTAICTYQELLADQICDLIFATIIEMYSPWLITYTEETIQQSSANWIRQLVNNVDNKVLYPWSEQHANSSRIIIKNFIRTLKFILENLPISHQILAHTFSWYVHHFSVPNIESYIYEPIHEGIAELPWEYFKPQMEHVDMLYDSLQKFIPESHAMLGHIFTRINWNEWFSETLPKIPAQQQTTIVSRLFTIFIKISFEPNIHIQINTSKILEDAINYPWHLIEYIELENLLQWFVATAEPTIVLKIPSETNYADSAVLDLIRLACAMMPERNNLTRNITHATAKRILYTRSMIRLQRACAAKHPKLLGTKDGLHVFKSAFEDLLNTLSQSLCALAATKTHEEQRREALNVMLEIILPMQSQSVETSNLHVDCMVKWQEFDAKPGNLLMCSILSSIGHMKVFLNCTYTLLEASIGFYFRSSQESLESHTPSWVNLLQLLQMSLEKLELKPIMSNSSMLTLHVFILYKMDKMPTVGDQITFLQDLSQLVENLKTQPSTEPLMAVVWGAMISWGCRIISQEPHNASKPLKMLARHLQLLSTQAEGWSDGILGAIGYKKDLITNKRKVLTRCLAIVIFSLFPHKSHTGNTVLPNEEYSSAMRELSILLDNKKFVDVKALVVQSISILNENPMPQLTEVSFLVCRLISLFYNNAFLITVPEVWEMGFKMSIV